jgi:hypothetical protein
VLPEHGVKGLEEAEDRKGRGEPPGVVEEADGTQSVFGVVDQCSSPIDPARPCSDNDRRLDQQTAAPDPAHDTPGPDPSCDEQTDGGDANANKGQARCLLPDEDGQDDNRRRYTDDDAR